VTLPEIKSWKSTMPFDKLDLTTEEREYVTCLERRVRHLRKRARTQSAHIPDEKNFDIFEAKSLDWVLSLIRDVCSNEVDDTAF
jgi:hypothetical protein